MVRPAAPKSPRLDSRREPDTQALRKDVLRELEALHKRIDTLVAIVNEIDTSGGGAPVGASYVTATVSGVLTDERVLTGGTNVTIDNTTPGQAIVNATGVTDEHIQDVVGALVIGGTGITATYNDGAATHTIATTITQYTDELAQDAVGGILTDSSTIDFTYNDGANTITAAVIPGGVDATALLNFNEGVDDRVAALFVDGNGIDSVYNDGAGTLTVTVDEAELAAASIGGAAEFIQDTVGTMITAGHGIDVTYNDGAGTETIDVDETELDPSLIPQVTRTLDKITTDLQVSSTGNRTIYTYSIPAGTVTTGDILRFHWLGHFFNNDGANRSVELTLSLGGTIIWRDTSATQVVSANRRPMVFTAEIAIQSNTLQIASCEWRLGSIAGATTGVGDIAASAQNFCEMESIDSTVDMSSGARILLLEVAIGPAITNTANVYVRRRCAYTEKL